MVEALTIVLAVGLTHNWRAALIGVVAALLALAAVVGALGPSLVNYVPIDALRMVIGTLLVIFGLQWLRKAMLRGTGRKAIHDEAQIFARSRRARSDPLREGVSTGPASSSHSRAYSSRGSKLPSSSSPSARTGRFGLAAAGAGLGRRPRRRTVGCIVHRPLSRVPENAIKFTVGIMLIAFGTFWGGEGVGVDWTLGDFTLPLLAAPLRRRGVAPCARVAAAGVDAPLVVSEVRQ